MPPVSRISVILFSQQPVMQTLRRLLMALGLVPGLLTLYKISSNTWQFLAGGLDNWSRDLYQYYLAARAMWDGISPYTPLNILADRYIQQPYITTSTPYPPPFLLLVAPLGLMDLRPATAIWLFVQLASLLIAAYLLNGAWFQRPSVGNVVLVGILLLGWHPFLDDLFFGNVSIIFLALFLLVWRLLRNQREIAGGAVLGIILALKLLGWLLLPYLLMTRRWRALAIALAVPVVANILGVIFLGSQDVWQYYTVVGREGVAFYQGSSISYSLWTLGYRLFSGTGAGTAGWIFAGPLFDNPSLAPIVSTLMVLVCAALSIYWAFTSKTFDHAFALLLAGTVLINPVAWAYYFTFLTLPVGLLVNDLLKRGWPDKATLGFGAVCLPLALPPYLFATLAISLYYGEGRVVVNSGAFTISPTLAMLTMLPLAGALGVLGLLALFSRRSF